MEPSDKIVMENVDKKYTITLKETVIKQQGAYKVKAINAVGELTAMATLKVKREYQHRQGQIPWCEGN